jgi:hypothetical protein
MEGLRAGIGLGWMAESESPGKSESTPQGGSYLKDQPKSRMSGKSACPVL